MNSTPPRASELNAGLLEWLDEAVLVFDAALRCVRANPAAEKLFGRRLVGEPASGLLPPGEGPALAERLAEVARGAAAASVEGVCIGGRCYFELSMVAQPNGGVAACLRDVTERRRSRAMAALQQEAHALRLNRATLGELLSLLARAAEAHFADGSCVEFIAAGLAGEPPRHLDPQPRLPPALRQAVEGCTGGAEAPFAEVWSGAVASGVEQVAGSPRWAALRDVAAAHRLHAAWAMPLIAPGKVIGAMAVYYLGDASAPADENRDLLFAEYVCGIASVAIERAHDREQRARTEALLRDEVRINETLNNISAALATELDLSTIVQSVTDGATALTGAQFGAFFYNTTDAHGAMLLLYTLSGSGREIFSRLPVPRPTAIFIHTFGGRGPLRIDDVPVDPRYGLSPPFSGLPPGHPPVRSYLAVPVVSPSGKGVIGGIFLGHGDPAVFSARHESLITGIAAQAAIAIENARLVASLRESADRLALAMSASELGDWRVDMRSGKLGFSDAAARIFGLENAQPMARSAFVERLEAEDRVGFEAALDAALASGSRFEAEYRIRRSDGVRRLALCGIVHRSSDAAVAPGMFGVVQDVTLSRQMEADLRERAEQLAEADRRKDEFLATLAHELRNPLAPLRTSLEILRRGEVASTVREQARSIMARQVAQMARLIDELIDISRISTGRIELRKEATHLETIIDSAIEIARPLIDGGRHRLTVRLPAPTPALLIDRTRAAQVLSNLLNNAAKYTPPGGEIEIDAQVDAGWLSVAIRDSGVGIAPHMLSRIFNMFEQGDRGSAAHAQGGLGVGLTLARRLVELHGGTLEAHSAGPGKGSEFVVRLPVLAGAAVAPPCPTRHAHRRPAGGASWWSTTTSIRPAACRWFSRSKAMPSRWRTTAGPRCKPSSRGNPRWCCSTSGCRDSMATRSPSAFARATRSAASC